MRLHTGQGVPHLRDVHRHGPLGVFLRHHWQDDKTRQDNNSVQKAGNSRRSRSLQKSAYRFRRVNISQSETALCSAVLAQSGTDAMVALVPWPVPGHQRLDARQSTAGCLAARKKKTLVISPEERQLGRQLKRVGGARNISISSDSQIQLTTTIKLEITCCIEKRVTGCTGNL